MEISHSSRKPTFCERAYNDPFIEIYEADFITTPPLMLSSIQYQNQSVLLKIFSGCIDNHPFKFLNKKDLIKCLIVCKKIRILVRPLFISYSISHIEKNFESLEKIINFNISFNSENFLIFNYNKNIHRKIISFKNYSIFLLNYSAKNAKDLLKIKPICIAMIKLDKACRFYSDLQESYNQTRNSSPKISFHSNSSDKINIKTIKGFK